MIVARGNGVTFKNMAVNETSDIIIWSNIEPNTVIIINGLSIKDSLKTERFSLRQFRTFTF